MDTQTLPLPDGFTPLLRCDECGALVPPRAAPFHRLLTQHRAGGGLPEDCDPSGLLLARLDAISDLLDGIDCDDCNDRADDAGALVDATRADLR